MPPTGIEPATRWTGLRVSVVIRPHIVALSRASDSEPLNPRCCQLNSTPAPALPAELRRQVKAPSAPGALGNKFLRKEVNNEQYHAWFDLSKCCLMVLWRGAEVSIPIRLLAVPAVFKTALRAVAGNSPCNLILCFLTAHRGYII